MSLSPQLSKPVSRKLFDFVDPTECVDIFNGEPEHLLRIAVELVHGANYNDPACYDPPSYSQLMTSGNGHF